MEITFNMVIFPLCLTVTYKIHDHGVVIRWRLTEQGRASQASGQGQQERRVASQGLDAYWSIRDAIVLFLSNSIIPLLGVFLPASPSCSPTLPAASVCLLTVYLPLALPPPVVIFKASKERKELGQGMLHHLGTRLDLPRALSLFPAIVDVGRDVAEELLSAHTKRAAMEKKAAAASVAAKDFAHRFESGGYG
ncbi:hypothetical protein L1887_39702 [Cichorium endivia]|nr:hypothetical protein L1887_39702 [Cichorium endivia]